MGQYNSTTCETYQEQKYINLAIVAASMGVLSFLASSSVISIIVLFKKYNFFIQRLILYLCLCAALNSASVVLRFSQLRPEDDNPTLHGICVATAFIDQTTLWSLSIAFFCLTFNMLIAVTLNRSTAGLEFGYIFFIFLFPLMFNWVPFLNNSYGRAGAWCWIRSREENCSENKMGLSLTYALWYGPHWVLLALLLVAYLVVVVNVVRKKSRWRGLYSDTGGDASEVRAEMQRIKELVLPLIFYPLGFLVLNLPPLINRVYESVEGPNYTLWMLHAILSPLQGGFIALVYVLDKETMQRLNLRELRAYLFHRQTPVEEYPATKGLTDSYDGGSCGSGSNSVSQGSSTVGSPTTDGSKVTLNDARGGRRGRNYGSMGTSKIGSYDVESEKV